MNITPEGILMFVFVIGISITLWVGTRKQGSQNTDYTKVRNG